MPSDVSSCPLALFAARFFCFAALKHECWQVVGRKSTVPQQWNLAVREIITGPPWDALYKPFSKSAIIARFNSMLVERSADNNRAAKKSGGRGEEERAEDDEAKKLVRRNWCNFGLENARCCYATKPGRAVFLLARYR